MRSKRVASLRNGRIVRGASVWPHEDAGDEVEPVAPRDALTDTHLQAKLNHYSINGTGTVHVANSPGGSLVAKYKQGRALRFLFLDTA